MAKREFNVYSQNHEDGVIKKTMDLLGLSYSGYYVEFGCEDGSEINTRYLRQSFNWTGLLMSENSEINLHKEFIMHWNVTRLFKKHKVPVELELFSEDTDYADYWIVEAVLKEYKPKVVVHEVYQQPGDICVTVLKVTILGRKQFSWSKCLCLSLFGKTVQLHNGLLREQGCKLLLD